MKSKPTIHYDVKLQFICLILKNSEKKSKSNQELNVCVHGFPNSKEIQCKKQ